MARTKDQSFVNRYLNQYQQNQKSAVSAGQQAASNAASSGVQQMNATGNIELPSLYDPTEDLYGFVLDQQEAQLKAQQAAAKAAQQAQEKAQKEAQERAKEAASESSAASTAPNPLANRLSQTRAQSKVTEEEQPKKGLFSTIGDWVSEGLSALSGGNKDAENKASTSGSAGVPARSLAKTAAVERPASAYDAMTVTEKLTAAQQLSDQVQALQSQIDALERQKVEPKTGAGAYDEEAYSIVQKNRQIVEQQDALEARRKQLNDQLSDVDDALWADPEYINAMQTEITSKSENERIAQYLDPSYKLNKLEERDAKEIIKRYRKEAADTVKWNSKATDEQRREAFDKEMTAYDLEMKISDLYALESNFAFAVPGVEAVTDAVVRMHKGDEYDADKDSVQAFLDPIRKQSHIASTAGSVGGTLASYAAGSQLVGAIPGVGAGLQSAGQAIGGTRAAQFASKVPVLGKAFTPEAITGILGDQLVDTVLDTGAGAVSSVMQGDKSGAEIAADAAKNFGTNLAFNIGSAAVLGTAGDVLNRWKASRAVPPLEDGAVNQAVNMGTAYKPVTGLDDTAQYAEASANDVPIPSLENAAQAAQSGADDVVSAWRSGTLTNAQLDTLKPGGVNRAAFEQATGVKLPDTSSESRRFLRSASSTAQNGQGTYRLFNPDDLDAYVNTGKRKGTRDAKRAMLDNGESPVLTSQPEVDEFVQSSVSGGKQQTIKAFGVVDERLRNDVLNASNGKVDLNGRYLELSSDDLRHSYLGHTNAKEAGDVPLTLQDYKNIPEYTFDYDDVIKVVQGSNGVKIQLGKKINGHTIITEIVSNERGAVTFKNMWGVDTEKYLRKYKSRAVGNRAASQLTPDASMFPSANTASANFSIPTLERNVNAQQIPSLEPDMPAGTVAADNAPPSLYDGLPESIGAMRHNPRSYAGMQVEYGTIAPGENAARVVDVPISTNGTDRVSASARTFMEAPQTTDELVGMFEKGVEDGLFSHDVKRDADSLARAVSAVEQDGYQNILTSWKNLMRTGASLNKEQIVQGQLLYTLAAKNGDTATAMELAGDLARIATESGQNLQAQRLLKRMTPEGKLYYAQQTVDSFNRQLKQQLGDGFQDIEIPEELARTLMDAKDAKAQNDAMQNIYQYVADQLPADWGTRWNAWRYLAMLSNPATHVRNVLSNAVNVPARKFKNILGAGIERLTLEEGQRTKSIINPLSASDRSLVEFANNDIENVMPQLTGAQKYSDRSAIKQMVDPFKVNGTWGKNADSNILAKGARSAADAVSGGLSSAYKFNSWALGAEDMLFKKGAYVDSLSQYLKANGIDPAKATQKQLDAAREYAVEEALRATYTEFNSMAQALGKLERKNIVTKVFFGGVVPFKSTPFNIIRRGIRYSPVGLMESVTNGVRRLRAGEINANQFIDNISQGLSGTAIFGLGMWLGANGIINGISPENKKEQSLKSSQGWQNYSINLPGGGTYTIDWGGPSVMAILAGVETAKAFEKDGYDFNEVLTALGNITEPMFDTTMLDGVNSAIQSATYAGSNPVTALVSQAASNFVTQAIPSLSGVVARAYDPVRRTAYSDQEGAFGTIDESKQRIMNKVPGLSESNQPYIDVWGREQENPGGSFVGRLAYGLLSPGYYSPDRSTVADGMVEDLYEATGDSGTLPGSFNSSVTVDGEKIKLSPENYTLAKQTKGQASKQMIESLYEYPQYNAMDAEMQADVVKGVYDLANDVAKYQVIPSLYDGLVSEIESGDASKSETLAAMYLTGGAEQVIPYLVADELTSDVRADKNAKGNSIPGSKEKNFIETLMQNGYTRGDAEALYQLLK